MNNAVPARHSGYQGLGGVLRRIDDNRALWGCLIGRNEKGLSLKPYSFIKRAAVWSLTKDNIFPFPAHHGAKSGLSGEIPIYILGIPTYILGIPTYIFLFQHIPVL